MCVTQLKYDTTLNMTQLKKADQRTTLWSPFSSGDGTQVRLAR